MLFKQEAKEDFAYVVVDGTASVHHRSWTDPKEQSNYDPLSLDVVDVYGKCQRVLACGDFFGYDNTMLDRNPQMYDPRYAPEDPFKTAGDKEDEEDQYARFLCERMRLSV